MLLARVSRERADETDRGLAVEGAASLLEQRRLLDDLRVPIQLEKLTLDLRDRGGARHPVELLGQNPVV